MGLCDGAILRLVIGFGLCRDELVNLTFEEPSSGAVALATGP
jgi:hypothetical protein